MADQFVGEIRMFGCNFAPFNWAQCNGQLLAISQNTALFSILGTSYGGDGKSTFALPNLQGRTALNQGQGNGLTPYNVGAVGGTASVTLQVPQMPLHNHVPLASLGGTSNNPVNLTWSIPPGRPPADYYANAAGNLQAMNPQALTVSGNGLPHNNLMPYQVVNFCVSLAGVYPQRQ